MPGRWLYVCAIAVAGVAAVGAAEITPSLAPDNSQNAASIDRLRPGAKP
jgi:hypothetical protein